MNSKDSHTGAGQVWLRAEQPRRQPLTRERIVEAALELLDTEGVDRLTMRGLAEHLGVGATTLYGHVATKDDVLDLSLDAVYAQVPAPDHAHGSWRARVETLMHQWRDALLRHPWSARLLARPHLGPHMLAREEALLAALVSAGLRGENLNDAGYALSNHVIGSVLMQVSWQDQDHAARRAATEHIQNQRESYPTLAAHHSAPDADWDRSFTTGLSYLLDGLTTNA